MIAANCVAAWCIMFYAINQNQSEWVSVAGFSFLTTIVAYYMHIGNKDLATVLRKSVEKSSDQSYSYNPTNIEPARPEDQID